MNRIYIILAFVIFFQANLTAQYDFINLNRFDDFQSAHLNPAYAPDSNLVIVLPGLAFNFAHTGPTLGDLIAQNSSGDNIIDIDQMLANLDPENHIRANFEWNLGNIYYQLGGLGISAGYKWKFDGQMTYGKEMAELYAYGNSRFIGEEVQVAPSFGLSSYHEFNLGLSKSFGKVSTGVRGRFISGVEDISTEKSDIKLFTSDDIYQMTLTNDLRINSSRIVDYTDIDDIDINTRGYSYRSFFSANHGLIFDFGIQAQLTDRLNVQASVLDLGKINWNSRVSNLNSQGTFSFEGIDLKDYIGDTTSIALEDSLREIFVIDETYDDYSTNLPAKYLLGMSYDVNPGLRIGGVFFYEKLRDRSVTALALNVYKDIGSMFNVGAQYAYLEESPFALGLSASMNLKFLQFRFVTDNVTPIFKPESAKFTNMRIQLALRI